jgi:murein DD-endopeptidase MepM/ murein hydrolase activator NlpD
MKIAAIPLAAAAVLMLLGSHALSPVPVAHVGAVYGRVVRGAVITQGFGCTTFELEPVAPWCSTGHFHSGIDLAAPFGTAVFADADGVAGVISSASGYGLHLILRHDVHTLTLYGHLSAVAVSDGEWVTAGRQVASIGSSGMSTGPHLHFEVRQDERPVDPTTWLGGAGGAAAKGGGADTRS